jgi:multiple sugar transport system ATP-binding protein
MRKLQRDLGVTTIYVTHDQREASSPASLAPAANDSTFIARVDSQMSVREGDRLQLVVDPARLHFFDPASGLALYGDRGR